MELKPGAHIHLIGICGTAMASLAGLLKDRGFRVSGSDSNPYPPMSTQLEALGIRIQKPYAAANLNPRPDFVIVGNVISANNEEATELRRLEIPYTSLPKAIGEWVIENRQCLNISGTHGKTTTTAIASWVWDQLGHKPGFLIGGVPKNFPFSFRNPAGDWFVIEGDEYDTAYFDKVPKFIHYRPRHVIFTSCEFDHADIYNSMKDVEAAFLKLMSLVPKDGTLIYWGESEAVRKIADSSKCLRKWSYGFNGTDYQAFGLRVSVGLTHFSVRYAQSENLGEFSMILPGEHNVLNALSVIAMAHSLGFAMTSVRAALATFTGVKRRQEILGEPGGVLVIEDFAHHPTAVKETLKAVKTLYPGRRLFGIFEPRSATSRRKIFQKDYVEALSHADVAIVMTAFDQAKIGEEDRFSSEELVNDLKRQGRLAQCFQSVPAIVSWVGEAARRGDVILIMSNGGFDGIYGKLLEALSNSERSNSER